MILRPGSRRGPDCLVPCDIAENGCFIFNNICKLYFEYLPDADAIRLLHFEFNVYGM